MKVINKIENLDDSMYITYTVKDRETNETLFIPIPKEMLLTQSREFITGLISQVIDAHFKIKR